RFLERVGVKEKRRIVLEDLRIRAEERHGHHVSGVLNQNAGISVIGMIVVGPMAHDNVGFPLTDKAGNGAAVLQSRQQLAVVDIQYLSGDAKNLGGLLNFGSPPSSQRSAR